MPQNKRKRDKRKPWVIAICVFVAFAMVFSTGLIVLEQFFRKDHHPQYNLDAYLKELEKQAVTLKQHVDQFGESALFLRELGNVYHAIAYTKIREQDPGFEDEIYADLERAVEIFEKLVVLEPDEPENYLLLFEMYHKMGLEEHAVEIAETADEVLASLMEEQPENNRNRYFYSYLLQHYHQDLEAARDQLELILESEPGSSELFRVATQQKGYLDLLISIQGEVEREEEDNEEKDEETAG